MRRSLTLLLLLSVFATPACAATSGAEYDAATEAELAGLALPAEAGARPDTVAVVTVLDGAAWWADEAETAELHALALGSIIPNGARVELADSANLTVAFNDVGTIDFKLGSKGRLENDGSGTARIFLTEGQLRALGRLQRPVQAMEVVTPAATVGIRGTEFEVAAAEDGATELYVDEGTVACSDQLSGDEMTVSAGEAAAVSAEAPAAAREYLTPEQRREHLQQMRRERRAQFREHFGEIIERMEPRFREMKEQHRRQMEKLHAVRAQRQAVEGAADRRLTREQQQERMRKWSAAAKQELLIYAAIEKQNQRLVQLKRWVAGVQLPPDVPEAAKEKLRTLGESLKRILEENREALRGKPELVNQVRQAQQRIQQYNQQHPHRPLPVRHPR